MNMLLFRIRINIYEARFDRLNRPPGGDTSDGLHIPAKESPFAEDDHSRVHDLMRVCDSRLVRPLWSV